MKDVELIIAHNKLKLHFDIEKSLGPNDL